MLLAAKIGMAGAAAAVAVMAGQAGAEAATYPDGTIISGGIPASHYCDGGGNYIGTGTKSLSNGTLTAAFCTSGGKVYSATDNYKKTGGTGLTKASFTWRFTNGGTQQHEVGPFTASKGQTFGAQGRYSPGISIPSGKCMQGVLDDSTDGQVYLTSQVCN